MASLGDKIARLVYGSYSRVAATTHGLDAETRDITIAQRLYDDVGIRFNAWPRVAVTGSKGKGSTSVLLAAALAQSGQRVGLVTSPHLRRFNERIRVNGACVSDAELETALDALAPAIERVTSSLSGQAYLGPGGVILALAAEIFARRGIDVLVVEAGRGGEFDEARLIAPDVSVLTPIMLEHPDKLGPTVRDIARTKTRIAAPGSTIVVAPQPELVWETISATAAELGAQTIAVDAVTRIANVTQTATGMVADLSGPFGELPQLHISLAGQHQIANAATALTAAQTLAQRRQTALTRQGAYDGLARVRWPGRCQVIARQPWILLDGAINAESARYACEIAQSLGAQTIWAVIGVPKPKDLDGVCREVARLTDKLVTTEVETLNLTWYEDALATAARYSAQALNIAPASGAFDYVTAQARPGDGILLLGTQSFVGAALERWDIDTCHLW